MKIKQIAIYLPQFHSIPENDKAWGKGFTEWINVKKAVPQFEGHYQPHVPNELVGYYNLDDPEVLVKQAAIAQEHGIYGFAYYHYWFNGKRPLKKPLDNMLKLGKPDFPFCYIWANENWTRRWDGEDTEVIIKQEYSFEDDLQHIRFLCENVFCDGRYITIDEKPLFLIYRTELFPDIKKTVDIWRKEVIKYGFKDIYLVRVESFLKDVVPNDISFDGAMEFAPDSSCTGGHVSHYGDNTLIDYSATVFNMVTKRKPYKYFHCVFPGWDNSPRRVGLPAVIYMNNYLDVFNFLLETQMSNTIEKFSNWDERLVFINAWNEWGEGCHIEPDKRNGMEYLNICKNAKPRNRGKFELFYVEQLNSLKERDKFISAQLETVTKKYNNIISNSYFKTGKIILSNYRWLRNIIRFK